MAAIPPVPDVPEIAKKRFPGRARFVPITQDADNAPGTFKDPDHHASGHERLAERDLEE